MTRAREIGKVLWRGLDRSANSLGVWIGRKRGTLPVLWGGKGGGAKVRPCSGRREEGGELCLVDGVEREEGLLVFREAVSHQGRH